MSVPADRVTPQRSEEIVALMRRLYRAVVVGDVEAVNSAFSKDPGVLAIGSDAAE